MLINPNIRTDVHYLAFFMAKASDVIELILLAPVPFSIGIGVDLNLSNYGSLISKTVGQPSNLVIKRPRPGMRLKRRHRRLKIIPLNIANRVLRIIPHMINRIMIRSIRRKIDQMNIP